jgi:hypothetical protein
MSAGTEETSIPGQSQPTFVTPVWVCRLVGLTGDNQQFGCK